MPIIAALIIGGYTNYAGNVVAGWPVKLTPTQVVLAERASPSAIDYRLSTNDYRLSTNDYRLSTNDYRLTTTYPLSIFPEPERRRIAADFGEPRVPVAVKRAIAGAEKAIARSRERAEKGLCSKEESEAFCSKTSAALSSYLDKQAESGAISPAERKALGK